MTDGPEVLGLWKIYCKCYRKLLDSLLVRAVAIQTEKYGKCVSVIGNRNSHSAWDRLHCKISAIFILRIKGNCRVLGNIGMYRDIYNFVGI